MIHSRFLQIRSLTLILHTSYFSSCSFTKIVKCAKANSRSSQFHHFRNSTLFWSYNLLGHSLSLYNCSQLNSSLSKMEDPTFYSGVFVMRIKRL